MALNRIPVQPDVLRWARETAGLDISTAAARIKVKPGRVEEWEDGRLDPTINQIRAMADVYVRPMAALFMQEPLDDDVTRELPDFRRPETRSNVASRALQKAIIRAHVQRDALRDVAVDLEIAGEDLDATFTLDQASDADTLGGHLRGILEVDSIAQTTLLRPEEFLRELVKRTETLNVTVIQVQRVDVKEMRGFSLGDGTCPIIALNGADWPRGKIYTLLHELAHVGFRSDGLCDLEHRSTSREERLCDEVAAATLMPRSRFLALLGDASGMSITADLARAAGREFGASGESALLRMVEVGRATWEDYWRLKPEFDSAYASFKAAERQRNAERDSPIYYQVKRRDLGRRFIAQMMTAYREDVLSSRDIAQLLEVSSTRSRSSLGPPRKWLEV